MVKKKLAYVEEYVYKSKDSVADTEVLEEVLVYLRM